MSGKIKLFDLQKDRFCGLFVLSAHLVYRKLPFYAVKIPIASAAQLQGILIALCNRSCRQPHTKNKVT